MIFLTQHINRELNELSEFLTASLFIKPQSGLLIRTIRLIRGS